MRCCNYLEHFVLKRRNISFCGLYYNKYYFFCKKGGHISKSMKFDSSCKLIVNFVLNIKAIKLEEK